MLTTATAAGYLCHATAHTPDDGRAFQLGTHHARTPRLALRWLHHRAQQIADQLDAPAARPARHWIDDQAEHEHALSRLAAGHTYTFTIRDDTTHYALTTGPRSRHPMNAITTRGYWCECWTQSPATGNIPALLASIDADTAAQAIRWIRVALRTVVSALAPEAQDKAREWLTRGHRAALRSLARNEPCAVTITHACTRIEWTVRPVAFLPLADRHARELPTRTDNFATWEGAAAVYGSIRQAAAMSAYSSNQELSVTDITGNGVELDVATNLLNGTVRLSILWTHEIYLTPEDAEHVAHALLSAAEHGRLITSD